MREKILSIIVPSYNMEQYLPKCLNSLKVAPDLMEQLEVLVVNDGSKDRTSEIAHEFGAKWPQTYKVIDKQNGHYGSCVNVALKVATGRFVKMLDADDSYDAVNFGIWLRFVSQNIDKPEFAEVDCFVTDYCMVDASDAKTGDCTYRIARDRVIGINNIPRHYVFAMHAVAWRRELLQRINYVQTEGIAYTDTEWIMYPLLAIRKLYYSPISVYRYLVGREGQSMDPSVFKKCVGQRVKMFMRMMKESSNCDLSNAAKDRLRFEAMMGVRALYTRAFKERFGNIDSFITAIDDAIKEWGADYYAAFDVFPFVHAWRRNRRLTLGLKIKLNIAEVFLGVVGKMKAMIKAIVMTIR